MMKLTKIALKELSLEECSYTILGFQLTMQISANSQDSASTIRFVQVEPTRSNLQKSQPPTEKYALNLIPAFHKFNVLRNSFFSSPDYILSKLGFSFLN